MTYRRNVNVLRQHEGFTLIELLVVMFITAILASLAAPSALVLKANIALVSQMHSLQSAVLLARHQAVLENTVTAVCPVSEDVASGDLQCSGLYRNGVVVWAQRTDRWEPIRVWRWPSRNVTNRRGSRQVAEAVIFQPSGVASRNMTWSMCANGKNRSLVLNRIGRPSLRDDWGQC